MKIFKHFFKRLSDQSQMQMRQRIYQVTLSNLKNHSKKLLKKHLNKYQQQEENVKKLSMLAVWAMMVL